jgi:hypothetical protein
VTSANHIGSREEPQPEPHHVSVDAIVDSASVHHLRKMQGLASRLWGPGEPRALPGAFTYTPADGFVGTESDNSAPRRASPCYRAVAGRSPDRGGRHLCPGGDDQRGGELAQAAALGDGADARLASRARLALGHGQRGALMARLVDRDIGAPAEGEPPVHVAYIVPLPIRANTAAQIRL